MKRFIKHATDKVTLFRGVKVAMVVGIVLALINHCDALVCGTLTKANVIQILCTFLVPFAVSTFSSAMHARHMELQEENRTDGRPTSNASINLHPPR